MLLLNTPYYRQIDNSPKFHGQGWRQCNLTSHAMAVEYLTKKLSDYTALGFNQPEDLYGALLDKYGDTILHDAHTQCLEKEFGLKSRWRTDLTRADVETQLMKGKPVPAGMAYRSSGHIVLIVGMKKEGLIINDPYGVRLGAQDSYDTEASGECDFYSWTLLNQVFWDAGPNSGWGRIFD